jgi:hypothetical protein
MRNDTGSWPLSEADELAALTDAVRAMDAVEIAVDALKEGSATWESTLLLVLEAAPRAARALAGRWPWLDERRSV